MIAILTLLTSTPIFGDVAYAAPTQDQMVGMLKTIDDRQTNGGDWRSLVYIEQKEKDKSDLVYQAAVYRRDADDKLMILFVKPQSEAGKGYLRLDDNLFMYDPTVGKWERRTERERIGGTGFPAVIRPSRKSASPRPIRLALIRATDRPLATVTPSMVVATSLDPQIALMIVKPVAAMNTPVRTRSALRARQRTLGSSLATAKILEPLGRWSE